MSSAASPLAGRTCLVTGATSGIGEATAVGLARLGARVLLVGRDAERGAASVAKVKRETGNEAVELLLADLASLDQVRSLAAAVLERAPQLHVLVNNAGVVNVRRETTVDGLETTFAVNHLAYFLLTRLLLERLRASAPARVVNVASEAHRFGDLDLDDLQTERRPYRWMRVYGASKLANVLFNAELARRLAGSGVTANCVHPGGVGTGLGANNGGVSRIVLPLLRPFMRSPESGARTSIYLASSPEVEGVSGRYFIRCRPRATSAAGGDADLARRLWDASNRLTGLSD
jgi:NAD(P)-dependent dehydrogenase (short-subunit alcohol dehydrogenase family)